MHALECKTHFAQGLLIDRRILKVNQVALDAAEQRLQAGSVLTGSMTELRDEVDAIVALFNAAENAGN